MTEVDQVQLEDGQRVGEGRPDGGGDEGVDDAWGHGPGELEDELGDVCLQLEGCGGDRRSTESYELARSMGTVRR